MPPQEGRPKPSVAAGERIIHAAFQIGNDMLMISDAMEGVDESVIMGTQTQISIHPNSREEAYKLVLDCADDYIMKRHEMALKQCYKSLL